MKKNRLMIITGSIVMFLFFSLVISLSFITSDVIGSATNNTIIKANIWNTEPHLVNVDINPATITLTPGTTTEVNCTAYAWDWNGYADVHVTDAVLYSVTASYGDSDDNNNHYTANTGTDCTCSQDGANATNATCICTFDIEYYSENGTWTCNMTVTDKAGEATERYYNLTSQENESAIVNELIGIYTPDELDFGNLSVTETSSESTLNISNYGNVDINVSVRGYGGTSDDANPTNSSLICELGNIGINYTKYSLSSGAGYGAMTSLKNASTQMDLSVLQKTDDLDDYSGVNSTYWMLKVPLTVGGACNGTLIFSAIKK